MDKYTSRGHLISGAPLARTLEVSISSMSRAVRIRDLELPYSGVQDLYLAATSGTLDTIVFPLFWDISHVTAALSITLDRDNDAPSSVILIQVTNPSSVEVVSAINAHPLLTAVNEQGYLRISAVDGDVWRIRINERPISAGQATMCHLHHGIFNHVYVDTLGSTPDPRSYGIRGGVKSSPSRVDTPTTNLSSYIQRHEDRTSSGINRAVDSVASNLEYIKDRLGSTRVRHHQMPIPHVYSGEFGERPIRWHREGDYVTSVVVDGSLLPILLPFIGLDATQLYSLTDDKGKSIVRGSKDVDLLDIYGSADDVYGVPVHISDIRSVTTFVIENDPVSVLPANNNTRLTTDSWSVVDEVTLNVEGVTVGGIAKGDLVHIQHGVNVHTFEVEGVPRDGRLSVKSAVGNLSSSTLKTAQLIPFHIAGGTLTITRGVLPAVSEWVYLRLSSPIRVEDLQDIGGAYISLPIAVPAYDLTSADKPEDTLVTLDSEVAEFLLRLQGPLYRDLSAHVEINLQGLASRQGAGKSIFDQRSNLLSSPDFKLDVPEGESNRKILSSVDMSNFGAPITFSKNSSFRNAPIRPMSATPTAYFDPFSERIEGLSIDACTFDAEFSLLTLIGEDRGKLTLKDQGRILAISPTMGGILELSSRRVFVIVEIINASRARLRAILGGASITPSPYPDIGKVVPCSIRFIPPTVADELTEYASTLTLSPSLSVESSTLSGSRVTLPTHKEGYAGKDTIYLSGALTSGGGALHLESLMPPGLNLGNVIVAAKVVGTTVHFMLGGTEVLGESQQGMASLNDEMYKSLIAPTIALGQENSIYVEGRSPSSLLNGALLRALSNLEVIPNSTILSELNELGAQDIVAMSLRDTTLTRVEKKIFLSFEASSHVKMGADPYPINNSERILNLLTGMYEIKSVCVLDNGAVELKSNPRLRLTHETEYLQQNSSRLSGAGSNSTGYYVLGTASLYTAVEETKEIEGELPVRTIHANANKSGLRVKVLPNSNYGISVSVGSGGTGIRVDSKATGVGMSVNRRGADYYAEAGKTSTGATEEEVRKVFTNPSIDSERLLFSPFIFTNFATTAMALGGDYASQLSSLTAPSGEYEYPQNSGNSSEISDYIFRGTSPAIRAVNLLPTDSEIPQLGGALAAPFIQGDRFSYREPAILVGDKSPTSDDPSMYGALSVFSEQRGLDEKLEDTYWGAKYATAQLKGDLHIGSGELVILPNIQNEAYRGDLKYYAYNVPHTGYIGKGTISGVRTHLVPTGDAGILPILNTEQPANYMNTSDQKFGQRKVVEVDHSLLAPIFDSLQVTNDVRRLYLESSYSQSAGKFVGKSYSASSDSLVVTGKGLPSKSSILQATSTRILGEPRRVSRWYEDNITPLGVREEGDLLSLFTPESDGDRYTSDTDIGRACRVNIILPGASSILENMSIEGNKEGHTNELDYLLDILPAGGMYLTDSVGTPALVAVDRVLGVTITYTGIVASVNVSGIKLYGPVLSQLLDLPLGGSDSLWNRVALLSELRVKVELFGKRWDLNASTVAADKVSITDTGASIWGWGNGITPWRDKNSALLDYLPPDEIVRITATKSGSFFRNNVHFFGDILSEGSAHFSSLSATSLVGSQGDISLSAGGIEDTNNVTVQTLYPETTRPSAWSAMRYMWDAYRDVDGTSGLNAHKHNTNRLPLYGNGVGSTIKGHQSIGIEVDDSFSANLITSIAFVSSPSSASPVVTVHRRDTGYEGSLNVTRIDGAQAAYPAYRSGISSLSSSVYFDLSDEETELHVCAFTAPDLRVTEGVKQLAVREFKVFNDNVDSTDTTDKEVHVNMSCGADMREGGAYLHRIDIQNGVMSKVTMPKVYRYKYIFCVNVVDKDTRYVQDTYILQINPVEHQYNLPHIRSASLPKLYGTGTQTRGAPAQYSIQDTWGEALRINLQHNSSAAQNVRPTSHQLEEDLQDVGYSVGSYAFINDVLYQNTSQDPNLPMLKDSIFGEKWGLVPGGGHQSGATLNGGFVGFIGEYFVPLGAQENLLYAQANNKYVNTVGSYSPALREAFEAIAELTPTRYVIRLPKPSSEWLGREFKVAVPSYSTHTGANPFLGVWSESRKVGSISDYFFYVYRGYWSEDEGGSILSCIYSINHTKDLYATHNVPVISESGLVGTHVTSTWPDNAFTRADLQDWGAHTAIALYENAGWVTSVYGQYHDPASSDVGFSSSVANIEGTTDYDIYFHNFGEPTYKVPYIDNMQGDIPVLAYPGYLDIDASTSKYSPKLSRSAETCDILVITDASHINKENLSIDKRSDIVDTVEVTPRSNIRLSYTCVPTESGAVDTTQSLSTYGPTEGMVYRWVRV